MRRDRGFTLVELLVAITLGALVTLMAHRVLTGLLDGSERLVERQAALDRASNARRALARWVGSLAVGPGEADAFLGGRERLAFTTWVEDAEGWPVGVRVVLERRDGALAAMGVRPEPFALVDSVRGLALDYLLAHGADQRWVREWISTASAPEAVRLRIYSATGADTLLLLVGGRG